MPDTTRFGEYADPRPDSTRTLLTFNKWDSAPAPTCSKHHTYRTTVPATDHQCWVCPSCGRFSDRAESYTGGYSLVSPTELDFERFIAVEGRLLVRGDVGRFPTDEGMDAALLNSPYEAKDDIKSFDGLSRWVADRSAWVVPYHQLGSFEDHVNERDWSVINIYEIVTDA